MCCIYGPNRNPARDQFLDDLHTRINPSIPTIVAGDFNTVFDRFLDRAGSDPTVSSRESSSSLLNLSDFCCVVPGLTGKRLLHLVLTLLAFLMFGCLCLVL